MLINLKILLVSFVMILILIIKTKKEYVIKKNGCKSEEGLEVSLKKTLTMN